MNELITVNYDSDRPTVSGRDLHEFLEVGTAYKDWFPRMVEYGFTENIDYCSFLSDRSDGLPGKPRTDHQLTLEMAKELCMIQRTDKGKQARQYFLQLEKDWNNPEKVMARALKIAQRTIEDKSKLIESLEAQALLDAPKAYFADSVTVSKDCILIRDLAKLLKQNGCDTGEKRLYEQFRREGYLIRQQGGDYNRPSQRAMELGLFEVSETTVIHSDGNPRIHLTTKVTGKGQVYFINKYCHKMETA